MRWLCSFGFHRWHRFDYWGRYCLCCPKTQELALICGYTHRPKEVWYDED
jgi:hypothetical protein